MLVATPPRTSVVRRAAGDEPSAPQQGQGEAQADPYPDKKVIPATVRP